MNDDCWTSVCRKLDRRTLLVVRRLNMRFFRLATQVLNWRETLVRPSPGVVARARYRNLDLSDWKREDFTAEWSDAEMVCFPYGIDLGDKYLFFCQAQRISAPTEYLHPYLEKFPRLDTLIQNGPWNEPFSLPSLTFLCSLGNSYVEASLPNLTNLQSLYLSHTSLRQSGVFLALRQLEELHLSEIEFAPGILTELSSLPKLRAFKWEESIDPDYPEELVSLTTLESLDLSNHRVTDETVLGMLRSTRLTKMALHVDPQVTSKILPACRQLQELELGAAITDWQTVTDLSAWAHLTSLIFAQYQGCSLVDSAFESLTNLQALDLRGFSQIGPSLSRLTRLHSLCLMSCDSVRDNHLLPLTQLKSLRLFQLPQITSALLAHFQALSLPVLYIQRCALISDYSHGC